MVAASVDEYLAGLSAEKRAVLEQLRARIRTLVPEATEGISYGMPAFKLGRRYFLGFGAAKEHCSFYVGRAPVDALAGELAGYRVWKGTINFSPEEPLPAELVAKLVQLRAAEYRSN